MARKFRIAALCTSVVASCVLAVGGGVYFFAYRYVRPFYEQALGLEPDVIERGRRDFESRATALISDAHQGGKWHALFTAEQINGWLATQLDENELPIPSEFRDFRVAISPEVLTIGFRTMSRGFETVVTVDASVFVTEEGAVAVRFMSVRVGALPWPVLQQADEIAAACEKLSLPVRWTQDAGQPVAIVELHSDASTENQHFFIDVIEFGEGELYVAGHTEVPATFAKSARKNVNRQRPANCEIKLDDYELRLTPRDKGSALKVARRSARKARAKVEGR